jgi:hypothetical protein
MSNIKDLNNNILLAHKQNGLFRLYSNGHISTIDKDGLEVYKTTSEIQLAKMYFSLKNMCINNLSYCCLDFEECWRFRELMFRAIFELYNKPIILVAKF